MDIKEFRIREDSLDGFYIERQFDVRECRTFILWDYNVTITKKWKVINPLGDQPMSFYIYGSILRNGSVLSPFKTKQEAIEYLEKLCTPDKFYYPADFKESHE